MSLLLRDSDIPFEEEVLRNPHSLKSWLRYINHFHSSLNKSKKGMEEPAYTVTQLNTIYERALHNLPGSYKLWFNYLTLRKAQVSRKIITDPRYEEVNMVFERSLVYMFKMPKIWKSYAQFLIHQQKIIRVRRVLDRALRSLPITQHTNVWPLYISLVKMHNIVETGVKVYRRYIQVYPQQMEEFIEYLMDNDLYDEAALKLGECVSDSNFVSIRNKSKHAMWYELCELICNNPDKVSSLNVDAIIRSGLRRYTDQLGQLWTSLANYYIRSGLFERARDVFEEAISTVTTVRDFTQVFDAYAQYAELLLSRAMEELDAKAESNMNDPKKIVDDETEVELLMARFEDLMERRPLLLNSVLLRQNPHNVVEWQKRIELLKDNPQRVIETYTEAVQTVDPVQAVGKLNQLWIDFAKFFDSNNQLEDADVIFEKATSDVKFLKVDDLSHVWCEWVEMYLNHNDHKKCLQLLTKAVTPPTLGLKVDFHDKTSSIHSRLHKSLKLWSLYADIEESFGTFATTKAVYDRILDLKISSPQIIINYGLFLKEANYFEESFKAYERGIGMFKWPNVFDIWNTYLNDFLERYGGSKLERARDLFEQCLESGCPPKFAKDIYILYAKLEEEHGMARHAMSVYERAIDVCQDKLSIFNIYLRKASEIYGLTRTRSIYEKAIEVLNDTDARDMCLRFSEMETKLGEIDRARAIFGHCSQMCDPEDANNATFWSTWKQFEFNHGNEDTVREMLRVKRSVQHAHSVTPNTAVLMQRQEAERRADEVREQMEQNSGNASNGVNDAMKDLDASSSAVAVAKTPASSNNVSFVKGGDMIEGNDQSVSVLVENAKIVINPDQIDIDDDDESDNSSESENQEDDTVCTGEIVTKDIPAQVFGDLKKN